VVFWPPPSAVHQLLLYQVFFVTEPMDMHSLLEYGTLVEMPEAERVRV
jgi:hypothetical protein